MKDAAAHDVALAYSPVVIGPLTLRNRFVKSATNEGMSPDGVPSRQLVQFHADMAAGGVGLTTLAYCAVSTQGCTLPNQICLDRATLPHLRALTDAVHAKGGAVSAQVTHGGCFTFTKVPGQSRPLSASGGSNKIGLMSGQYLKRQMNAADMERIAAEFARGAQLAREAGFDAVEIHMGHGYLLSQFLSPLYNKRNDLYGGTLDNRLRFPREVLRRVLDAVGEDLAVICKYSMVEGARGGNGGLLNSMAVFIPLMTQKGRPSRVSLFIVHEVASAGLVLAHLLAGQVIEFLCIARQIESSDGWHPVGAVVEQTGLNETVLLVQIGQGFGQFR
ncbi:NADH:flavin oxidoreductase [Pseudomonas sp. FME51]|uniref:NADH:flavin oxidoreductase n=1 Tax=Pseudomonas sp. FME51 TaxID=2742609 RepID=UPI001865CC00|nr:NADH:flavin oxidoreductase [Pseudomonas sp. FME51]